MSTSCRLLVYYPDDFRIFSGTLTELTPMTVRLNGVTSEDFEGSVMIKLKWYEDDAANFVPVTPEGDSEEFILTPAGETVTDKEDSHFIEFRSYFEIVKADPANIADLKIRVDKINNRFRSTLTTQIKKIITDEELTYQYLFKLLIQIDSKMDELLDTLKSDDAIEGLTERRLYGLGGGGISFGYEKDDLEPGDTIYMQSMPKNGAGVNFAALCRVTDIIDTGLTRICETEFDYIDETTKETVIHYIFQKDREQLKRKRN